MPPRYEIRLVCRDGEWSDEAFADLDVVVRDGVVLLLGRLDQSALHGVLERIRARRYRVLDVRRARSRPARGRRCGAAEESPWPTTTRSGSSGRWAGRD